MGSEVISRCRWPSSPRAESASLARGEAAGAEGREDEPGALALIAEAPQEDLYVHLREAADAIGGHNPHDRHITPAAGVADGDDVNRHFQPREIAGDLLDVGRVAG